MVKLFIKNDKLYLRTIKTKGREISDVTIYHYVKQKLYNIEIFLKNNGNEYLRYRQKTYPIENIKLEKFKIVEKNQDLGDFDTFYYLKNRNYTIRYFKSK